MRVVWWGGDTQKLIAGQALVAVVADAVVRVLIAISKIVAA